MTREFMKRFITPLLMLMAAHFGANSAFAGPATYGGAGPSSGTVIAAAMETAGYISQAQILGDLNNMLEALGGLVYLCCVISAVLIASLSGRYPAALWLVLGPAIFFFLIRAESSAAGVEWQFGTFRDRGNLQLILRGANVQQAQGRRVSNFFHQYNIVISHSFQEFVKILTKRSTRDQMIFMARQKVIDDMFAQRIDDPGLYQLTRFTFLQCEQELNAARLVALGQNDPEFRRTGEYGQAVVTYCQLFPLRGKHLPNGDAKDWVKTLLNIPLRRFEPRLEAVSCEELWGWMNVGAVTLSIRHLEQALLRAIPNQAPAGLSDEVVREIATKLARPSPFYAGTTTGFQCVNGGPGGNGNVNVTAFHGVPFIMSRWLLRGTFLEGPIQSQQAGPISQDSNIQPATLGARAYSSSVRAQGQEMVRRYKNEQLGESAKYEAFMLAKLLPYFQGAGLYVLATIYPFFCLLVIIPGHAGGFMVWLALWAWLKSWDIGWAVVYVADELLWHLMPHRSYVRMGSGPGVAGSPSADPVTLLESAFAGDYSYSLTTYWVLLAGMLGAVPVISAHAVLGSKRAIAGIFVDGAKTIGQVFSKAAGDWVAMEQLGEVDRRIQQQSLFSRAAAQVEQSHLQLAQMQQAMSADLLRQQSLLTQELQMHKRVAGAADAIPGGPAAVQAAQRLFGAADSPFTHFQNLWNQVQGYLAPGTLPPMRSEAAIQRDLDAVNAKLNEFRRNALAQPGGVDPGFGFGETLRARWRMFRENWGAGGKEALARDIAIVEEYMNSGRTANDQRNLAQRLHDATINAEGNGAITAEERARNGVYGRFYNAENAAVRNAFRTNMDGLDSYRWNPATDANHRLDAGGPTPGTNRLLLTIRDQYMNSQAMAVLGGEILQLRDMAGVGGFTAAMVNAALPGGQLRRLQGLVGTVRAVAGGAQALGTFEAAELTRFYFATQALSLEMERNANHAAGEYLQMVSRHYFYQAARSDEFAAYERIRAGITGRVEWWSSPDAPYNMEMEADRASAHLNALGSGWLTRLQVGSAVTTSRQIAFIGSGGIFGRGN